MAKGQTGADTTSWVPSGLKVRGAAPVSAPQAPPPSQTPYVPPVFTPPRASPNQAAMSKAPPKPANDDQRRLGPVFRPMPVLTLLSLLCLALLIWLGSWQWEKFVQKSHVTADTTPVEAMSVTAALELSDPEYRPVIVDGLIDPRTIKVAAVQDGERGYRLFSPVLLEAGGVFVERGFVSEANLSRVKTPSGQVSITGVMRTGAKSNAYTPDNEPANDVWYWPDLKAMADTLMIQATGEKYYVAQAQVDPLGTGTPVKNPYVDRRGASQIPAERHLGYALTWWGFGLALVGVYIGMHVRAGRLRLVRKPS